MTGAIVRFQGLSPTTGHALSMRRWFADNRRLRLDPEACDTASVRRVN